MRISAMALPEVLLLQPQVIPDQRGYFFESLRLEYLQRHLGYEVQFVQESQSFSLQHVVRGLHYQVKTPQAKLVKVQSGRIFDVAVDLRLDSATFGRWCATELCAEHHHQLFIPAGFAHGFQVLSEHAEVMYKTSYYNPANERAIRWNDPELAIDWPVSGSVILSTKDAQAAFFKEADYIHSGYVAGV
jgi:dTDP-4-dehydrorhamnose 3,5-epimerase